MASFLITYDLIKTKDYPKLHEAIQSYSNWSHPLESVWIVISNRDAESIRNHIKQFMDADDKLFVTKLPNPADAAWMNLGKVVGDWLTSYL